MKKELKKIIIISFFVLLSGCGAENTSYLGNNAVLTGKVIINLYNPSKYQGNEFNKFKIQYIDPTDVFNANISITGTGISSPITNATSPANPIRLPNGKKDSVTDIVANSVPLGNNRIISVQGLDKSLNSLGTPVIIKGVTNVTANFTSSANISWQTTPTAKVIEKLISLGSAYSSTVNYTSLQTIVDKIVNNNTPSNLSDDIHPSLVNSDAVATYINSNSGSIPNSATSGEISTYRLTPGTISGNISGITVQVPGVNRLLVNYIPPTKVYCNDPASSVVTITDTSGNYTITGVTPGTGYTVKVVPDFYTAETVNNVPSGATNVNFSVTKHHYLEHSIDPTYGVYHFKTTRPINVQLIIPNATRAGTIGYTSDNRAKVIEAFNMWEMLASDVLSFNILSDIYDDDPSLQQKKTDADIYVEWVGSLAGTTIGWAQCYPDVSNTSVPPPGVTISGYNGSVMPSDTNYRASISLAVNLSDGQKIPSISAREVAGHEIGHALGLALMAAGTNNTHPQESVADLLYPSTNFSQPTNLNIDIRDLNTLRFLYSIPPNFTRN